MSFMDEINDIKNKIENEPQNEAVDAQVVSNEQILKNMNTSQQKASDEATRPNMTQEQANAIMSLASRPKDFIGAKVSEKINELAENDDEFKQKIHEVAKDTTDTALDTFNTDNKKQKKTNFFELNEKDIAPLGGDKSSSKGQQISLVLIRRFFWVLIMSTLGFFFIAPLTVMVELFQGITFKTVEKEEIKEDGTTQKKYYVTRTKLGGFGTVFGIIIGIVFDVVIGFLIVKFKTVFLFIAIGIFVALGLVNIFSGIKINFKKKDEVFISKKTTEE